MKRVVEIIVSISILNLGACALLPKSAPKDLKFDSICIVDTRTLSASKQEDISDYKFNPLPREVLEVRFMSSRNLVKQRRSWGDTYLWTAACRDWKDVGKMAEDPGGGSTPAGPMGLDTSRVYWKNANIFDRFEKAEPSGTGPFQYHFYIDITRKNDRDGYDLGARAQDICFQIKSAEFLQRGARTNVATIPKEAIAEALRNGTQCPP